MIKYRLWLYMVLPFLPHISYWRIQFNQLIMFNQKHYLLTQVMPIFCHSPYLPTSMNHQKTFYYLIISWNIFVTTLMCQVFYWLDKAMEIRMFPRTWLLLSSTVLYVKRILLFCTELSVFIICDKCLENTAHKWLTIRLRFHF